jgi:hypothetical protein
MQARMLPDQQREAGSVRTTIEYLCRLLASYEIQLTAETLRQAKFDGAAVGTGDDGGRCPGTRPFVQP